MYFFNHILKVSQKRVLTMFTIFAYVPLSANNSDQLPTFDWNFCVAKFVV